MTILEENRHTLLILEHDPLLYEDAREMVEYVSRAMKEAANRAIVLLYSPAVDPSLEEMMSYADRIFYFDQGHTPRQNLPEKTVGNRRRKGPWRPSDGRSFESVRMGAKEVSLSWARAGRALKKEDQVYASRLAEMAKMHFSEAFYALDDPLERPSSPCWWS